MWQTPDDRELFVVTARKPRPPLADYKDFWLWPLASIISKNYDLIIYLLSLIVNSDKKSLFRAIFERLINSIPKRLKILSIRPG